MATIAGVRTDKVYSISKWLGLHEHPDGDTNLKLGEAAKMVNWKVTRDGNLKRRPGLEFFAGLNETYEVSISNDVVKIGEYAGDEKLRVYASASAMANPGTITLVDASGVVERGVYRAAVDISAGTVTGTTGAELDTEYGTLKVSGTTSYTTIAELAEQLSQMSEGEYVYVNIDDVHYALRNDSMAFSNNVYTLSGYVVSAAVSGGTAAPVAGMWAGIAGGKKTLLAACAGKVWSLYDADADAVVRSSVGNIDTDKGVNFIPFENKVYIQNGKEYYVWDGVTLDTVAGYVPLIATAIGPTASADAGELTGYNVNLLTPKRRVWLSPDGDVNKTFKLPEIAKTVDSVKYLDGSADPTS